MSTVNVRLPNSIHKQLAGLARRDGISVDQLITTAVVEKTAALMTLGYLEERGKRGSWERFEAALASVPDVEPEEYDKL